MIDFHNHLIPGVDDGASDLDQSRTALEAMREQGVRALVATPHLMGSLTGQPERLSERLAELDAGWERLRQLVTTEFPELRVERGAEVMLDTPHLDLADARVRLAGTRFVLLEFPFMTVPPNSGPAIFDLRMQGWTPIIAHPERYSGIDSELDMVEEWRRVGGLLQVNAGSLLGRYGGEAKSTAWRLLRRGWVDYISSDYHARGRLAIADVRAKLEEKGAARQARILMEINPDRMLAGKDPEPVPPLELERRTLWRRILSLGRR